MNFNTDFLLLGFEPFTLCEFAILYFFEINISIFETSKHNMIMFIVYFYVVIILIVSLIGVGEYIAVNYSERFPKFYKWWRDYLIMECLDCN